MVHNGICRVSAHYQLPYQISSKSDKNHRSQKFSVLVSFGWSGWQDKKWILSCLFFFVHFILLLLHFQPPYLISSESDKKHRRQKFSLLVNLGWQVAKWTKAYQTHSMLFLPHQQPSYQISSKSGKKHRSWKFSLLVNFGWSGWQVEKWSQPNI